MDFMFDWDGEGDRFSLEDSDHFEEDSLCSWMSDPESLCNNWRGWRRQNGGQLLQMGKKEEGQVTCLLELAAQAVAGHIPFEEVETFYPPIPEQLQLRIAFWSFPECEEDIRLYSCLANGSAEEFSKGEHLFKAKAVKDALQIGFHLSATIVPPQQIASANSTFNVSVVFDRRKISLSDCSCGNQPSWCSHVVALCLFRIHQHSQVTLRAPVSESLSRLQRDQLQKFAQYLISELPQQILPTAQRLLDELLSSQQSAINTVCGAPDPTAGPSSNEITRWNLDETTLHDNIKKTLIKFCVPSPTVFSDVTYLSSTAPPAASEWQSLLRPMRGREPEGMWNLLSIVREMYRRHDSNAIPLLEILTEEILSMEQIMMWWFQTKISASHTATGGAHTRGNTHNNSCSSQHAASSLCDEIVTLWRLAALNPSLSPIQRDDLETQLKDWHIKTIDKVRKARTSNPLSNNGTAHGQAVIKKNDIEIFSGFKASIEACGLDWSDYEILGITYVERYPLQWHFSFGKAEQGSHGNGSSDNGRKNGARPRTSQVSGCAMKSTEGPLGHLFHLKSQEFRAHMGGGSMAVHTDGSSSEGFCDADRRSSKDRLHDSDSDLGADISDAAANAAAARTVNDSSHVSVGSHTTTNSRKSSNNSKDSNNATASPNEAAGSSSSVLEGGATGGATSSSGLKQSATAPAGLHIPPHVQVMKSDDMDETLSAATVQNQLEAGEQRPAGNAAVSDNMAAGGATAGADAPAGVAAQQPQPANGGDEYQVYFYDTRASKALENKDNKNDKKKKEEPNYFAGIKKIENAQDILFARAEALHAHGHTKEACKLARSLAEEMLNNPPDLTSEAAAAQQQQQPTTGGGKGKKNKKQQNNISSFASSTLAKAAFLCSVLLEEPDCHHLAFRVGLFGLEIPRPPASSKALEVKLAYQESELVTLLKKIPLGAQEMSVIRERAEKLRDGKLKSRGEALLPLMLASFIFDSLCLPTYNYQPVCRSGIKQSTCAVRLNTDEKLGFDACVAALGLKANVSEAEHPLLCEGTRRQRGELLVAMIVHYKDDQIKLSKIMDKVLDKEVHQLYKAPSLSTYLNSKTQAQKMAAAQAAALQPTGAAAPVPAVPLATAAARGPLAAVGGAHQARLQLQDRKSPSSGCGSDDDLSLRGDTPRSVNGAVAAGALGAEGGAEAGAIDAAAAGTPVTGAQSLAYLNLEGKFSHLHLDGAAGSGATGRQGAAALNRCSSKDTDSSAVEDEGDSSNYKAWEAKFRCTNLKSIKKPSVGMASIDSSAPETTSSDNSPTLERRKWSNRHGPGSDSGSSGKSSDSLGSSLSMDKLAAKLRDDDSPAPFDIRGLNQPMMLSRSSTPGMKVVRFKGKRGGIMPTVPNQPSEATAHFMFELAKTVLNKAGGSSSTALFTQPTQNNNQTGPHRNLHLCAFQIGLYALGLHNCVSPNWLSRTYSSHVSWITGQAMEIGSAAINILIDTWEGHLTPQEVASLADRASRCREENMVRTAADLALSCLPQSQALNPTEIQRALIQCKEQSREKLELACLAVETAAKSGGVYPDVLFDVARRWAELYEETVAGGAAAGGVRSANAASGQACTSGAGNAGVVVVEGDNQALVPAAGNAAADQGHDASPPLMQLPHQIPAQVLPMQAAAGQMPPPASYSMPPPPGQGVPHTSMPHHPYIAPYSYVQAMQPNYAHHYSAPPIPLVTHSIHPSYMASYPYQNPAGFINVNIPPGQNTTTVYHANISHLRPPALQMFLNQQGQPQAIAAAPNQRLPVVQAGTAFVGGQSLEQQVSQAQAGALVVQQSASNAAVMAAMQQAAVAGGAAVLQHPVLAGAGPVGAGVVPLVPAGPHNLVAAQHPQAGGGQHPEAQPTNQQIHYLQAAYRVGMLAMETLSRKVHEDRPQTKYAKSPPNCEEIKWLLHVSMKLGHSYVQQFCVSAGNAVFSPFLLQDIAYQSAVYMARSNNPNQVQNQLRSPTLNSLLQKCLQMYTQCTHQRMHHIPPAEYDEFVSIVCHARAAFCMTPGGPVQFNELLQSLRRSKSCKKELWQRIVNGLATGKI